MVRSRPAAWCIAIGFAAVFAAASWADDEPKDDVPAPFAPFGHMIGAWKGTAIPTANRLKGWEEKHMWAWKFEKGKPVGMSLELQKDKSLTKGVLTYDAKDEKYLLKGTDADGKPVEFAGAMDAAGKGLVLDRVGESPEGKERLVLRPNSNMIRYQLVLERQSAGATRFKPAIDVGLTKEGESFAAGGAAADLPKCILTGGSATMTVTYQGKSYPVCCTGCRDEFNENPEKYVKKALLRGQAGEVAAVKTAAAKSEPTPAADEDMEAKPAEKSAVKAKPKAKAAVKAISSDAPKKAATPASRAASLLAQAQALEQAGKTSAALTYYKRIAKDFAETPQAKTAKSRIDALQK